MADATIPLTWRIKKRSGFTTVVLFGEIGESAEFSDLARQLSGVVVFQLGEVSRLNSVGVREWMSFIRSLRGRVNELVFSHCSPAIVGQLNMISNFAGDAIIRSFYAPFACIKCGREEDKLLDVQTQRPSSKISPELPCEGCGGVMRLDDLPERYLGFLDA